LRAQGWIVIRFWEHQLKKSPQRVVKRMAGMLDSSKTSDGVSHAE
jgi:very-short-patch-repair endonuclease